MKKTFEQYDKLIEATDSGYRHICENKVNKLNDFLVEWDQIYLNSVKNIDLFNAELTSRWSWEQKGYFAKIFYHSRGYFRDFLWYLGNFAPNKEIKDIILSNIEEEFNENNLSHEQYYLDFAKSVGADLEEEILYKKNYTEEMKIFNQRHLKWLYEHDWESGFSAFSAYERLDVVDYELLAGITKPEHIFFSIHRKAKHFDKTYFVLQKIWIKAPEKVKEAFDFIGKTQRQMWEDLSSSIFNFKQDVEY